MEQKRANASEFYRTFILEKFSRNFIFLFAYILLFAPSCTQQTWPEPVGTHVQRNRFGPTSNLFPYCPSRGSYVERRLLTDSRRLTPIIYTGDNASGPCTASAGGSVSFFDVLGFFQTTDRQSAETLSHTIARLFPLEVGRRAETLVPGLADRTFNPDMWHFTFEVIRAETLDLGFGRFQTYVVHVDERGVYPNRFHRQHAVWIDERTRIPVRVTRRLLQGLSTSLPDWQAANFGQR